MTRKILSVTGTDAESFLQGLVTNDLAKLDDGLIYAALLSPQGKYLFDFFLLRQDGAILVDVAASQSEALLQRLSMYRLRADVTLSATEQQVARGTGPRPPGAHDDPRHPSLGWRLYGASMDDDGTDWEALRVAALVPETGIELTPDTFILEAGFERLNGVDFRKGCYVGQEVTARMKHKTELRKGLTRIQLEHPVPLGTPILANDKETGKVLTQSGNQAIAYLRFDRAQPEMSAGGARVLWSATGNPD